MGVSSRGVSRFVPLLHIRTAYIFYSVIVLSSKLALNSSTRRYISPQTDIRFQQVLEDRRTNSLYILDQHNKIYKFDSHLNLIRTFDDISTSEDKAPINTQIFLAIGNSSSVLACSTWSCAVYDFDNRQSYTLVQNVSHCKRGNK